MKVSDAMTVCYNDKGILFTSESCRMKFAQDFAKIPIRNKEKNKQSDIHNVNPVSIVLKDVAKENNLQTFDEMIECANRLEDENMKRKSEIFKRVLASMSDSKLEKEDLEALEEDADFFNVKSTWEENIKKREFMAYQRSLKEKEEKEREMLIQQRELLKKRHEDDSSYLYNQTQKEDVISDSNTELTEYHRSFSIDSYLNSQELDRLLTDIEKEMMENGTNIDATESSGRFFFYKDVILLISSYILMIYQSWLKCYLISMR